MGSNPVQVTTIKNANNRLLVFLFLYRKMLIFVKKIQILTLLIFTQY